ncbi:hypothetical protein ABIC50_002909 [Burkholderia sp. 567]
MSRKMRIRVGNVRPASLVLVTQRQARVSHPRIPERNARPVRPIRG